jgi:hypothetical protein
MNIGNTSLDNLAKLASGVKSRRWSSYDKTGGNADFWLVHSGETIILGEMEGPGCIKHIWMTVREEDYTLRRLVLRMYWDGEESPSVLCPIGDFFGLGHAKANYFESLPLQASYLGLNCWFAMPYSEGARVTVTNDSDKDSFLYFYIDYQEWEQPLQEMGRFHSQWRRELVMKKDETVGTNALGTEERLNRTGDNNYVILDVQGRGHYVGCCLHLDSNKPGWWGEGDDMFFIDGERWPPSLHGTGTEDYFCGAWCYNFMAQTHYTPYYGYHFRGNSDGSGKHSQYRFHIEDPVYFERSLRFSIEHGHANDWQGDWSSTAYWYQVGRKQSLPGIKPFEERIPYSFGGVWPMSTRITRTPGKDRKELPW